MRGEFTPTIYSTNPTFLADMTGFGDPAKYPYTPIHCVVPVPAAIDPNLDIPDAKNDPYTFRVNVDTATANAQSNPCVAMDPQGDFVIAYQSQGPDQGYFNNIIVRKFDRDGKPLDSGITVNDILTNINYLPYVAMDNLGDFVVTWGYTSDPNYELGKTYQGFLQAKLYSSSEQVLLGGPGEPQLIVPGGSSGGKRNRRLRRQRRSGDLVGPVERRRQHRPDERRRLCGRMAGLSTRRQQQHRHEQPAPRSSPGRSCGKSIGSTARQLTLSSTTTTGSTTSTTTNKTSGRATRDMRKWPWMPRAI